MKLCGKSSFTIIRNLMFAINEVFSSSPSCFVMGLMIQLLNTTSQYIILYFGKNIINALSNSFVNNSPLADSLTQISIWIILSSVFSIVLVFANFYKNVINQRQQLAFGEYINIKMAKKCMELDISYFDSPQYYDKIEKAQDGKVRLGFIVYRVIFFIANIISFIIALAIALSSSNFIFPIIILVLTLPALLTRGKYYRQQFEYESSQQNTKRKISYLAGLILGKDAAKEVRFYEMENFLSDKYRTYWGEYFLGIKKIILKRGTLDSFFSVIPILGILLSMYFVVFKIINGAGQIGDFSYLLAIYTSLSGSFLSLIEDLAKLSESEYSIQKFNEFMETESHIKYSGVLDIENIDSIEFCDVCFKYPETERIVLEHICFRINAKQKNAIVGINGAGKTTIIKLLLRCYDVTSGEILINDIDIKKYNISKLRSLFSAVFQDFIIYSLSIRDNVSFSDYEDKNNDNRIIEALKFSELNEDITRQNANLDTFLSRDFTEDGIELSGGQRQKLAIARCAFSKAQVLVMDEPTASLDPEAEYNIVSKFNELYKNKGMLLISHRLSNMRTMDHILVIKNGKVIEKGSHDELINNNSDYYQLYRVQADKYKVSETEVQK